MPRRALLFNAIRRVGATFAVARMRKDCSTEPIAELVSEPIQELISEPIANCVIATYWSMRCATLEIVAHAATGITFGAAKVTKTAFKVKTSGEPWHSRLVQTYLDNAKRYYRVIYHVNISFISGVTAQTPSATRLPPMGA